MMKAVFCEQPGPPESLVIRDIDVPEIGDDEVLVEMKAAGVSFVDVLMVAGEYQVKPEMPFIPGQEGGGVIQEVGANVKGVKPGDRVMTSHPPGAFAEYAALHASRVTPIPDNMDFAQAASFRSNYTTSYLALDRARLQPGEVLLVHGAAGGVGLAAVHLGKLRGATVIATASDDEKLKVVKDEGADHVINYSNGFRDQVKELTGGKGADVIYDPVGGDVFDESMRCINYLGRILIIGFTGGRPALAKTNHLLIKDATAIGMTVGSFSAHEPEKAKQNFEELMKLVEDGKISPYVSHRLQLDKVAAAMNPLETRTGTGQAGRPPT
ncbi:MAG: NADPH:quinone oxidoreductase family protein, partial [Pseudomonadales bacterium]|nr:NADPH:quinone oxidoreductase family protein [Pseudomonadales bacterium]